MSSESQIIRTEYSDVMRKSYIDYAMSVIISRALPDVRDGLKPVQRRTLYDMYELGIRYDKPYRKCARIVGDTMGKYHPHGDSSIYELRIWTRISLISDRTLMRQKKNLWYFRCGFRIFLSMERKESQLEWQRVSRHTIWEKSLMR